MNRRERQCAHELGSVASMRAMHERSVSACIAGVCGVQVLSYCTSRWNHLFQEISHHVRHSTCPRVHKTARRLECIVGPSSHGDLTEPRHAAFEMPPAFRQGACKTKEGVQDSYVNLIKKPDFRMWT
jgi:hypothetical protein